MIPKVSKSIFLGITVIVQLLSVVTATISYASIKSNGYDEEVEHISQYIGAATAESPLVIFQFKKFPLVEEFSSSKEHLPFLTGLFANEDVTRLEDQSIVHLENGVHDFETFEVLELPSSASEHLYDRHLKGKKVVLFDFQDGMYDLEKLDELLESVCFFLEDSLYVVENVVLNINEVANEGASRSASAMVSGNSKQRKEHKVKEPVSDDSDKLSDIWTEGLLMCLLVSFFLIVLLVVAISWVGTIEISYGALEKSTNPLKKTK